ncbi:hypothetical protein LTR08_009269 [Meristemomyces frigidus]|nr:hypothetical protein LTR08_009269 [Meristemomyces frigidus]
MKSSAIIAIGSFLLLTAARVIWIPAEFDPDDDTTITSRDTAASSTACSSLFPDDFTCPHDTTCLPLNTTSSIRAVICCPAGQDCSAIRPVSCVQTLQNATTAPDSLLHADPTSPLDICGAACCPMGYLCQGGLCSAQSAASAASSSTSSLPSAAATAIASSATEPASSESMPSPTATNATLPYGVGAGSRPKFSGAAFAAGFVPGIFLGAFLTACLLLILFRRKRRSSTSYVDEKRDSRRDTLTDLGPLSRRPTMHGRSISQPVANPSAGHRTDFSRSTSPRSPGATTSDHGYTVDAVGPVTPARTPKAVKAVFSHSPFMNQNPASPISTQPPLPGHLKRGTLSFTISPVRALKKQKSMHSFRRQMTEVSRGNSRRIASRSGSTETIKVLMPSNDPYTPDQRSFRPIAEDTPASLASSVYQPHVSASTWRTDDSSPGPTQPALAQYTSSSRYPTQTFTPTHAPGRSSTSGGGANGGMLGSPYNATRYYGTGKGRVTDVILGEEGGLTVVRQPEKRDTTFSAMMEKAGIRRSDLIMGSGNR